MTINLKNFLNPKIKGSKMGDFQELEEIKGLSMSSISADLYGDGRDDLTLFFSKKEQNLQLYTLSQKLPHLVLIGI